MYNLKKFDGTQNRDAQEKDPEKASEKKGEEDNPPEKDK